MLYHSLDHVVETQALTIHDPEGKALTIRPKTCQLVALLLQRWPEVVSKQEMLDNVWPNTVVEEQVIFQSIREIRQLFNNHNAIKTIPKQGYKWVPPVTLHDKVTVPDNSPTDDVAEPQSFITKIKAPFATYQFSVWSVTALMMISVLGIGGGYIFKDYRANIDHPSPSSHIETIPISGSVVVLPVDNRIQGNDHSWIRLGMMDQLIQRLPSSQNSGVLQTDYVLEILERAKVPAANLRHTHIPSIFQVSGAELIIALTLSGTPSDYELGYTFYRRQGKQQGVLFSQDPNQLIDQLSTKIHKTLGRDEILSADEYQADFHHEMLGVAIDLGLEGNFPGAIALLQSLIQSDPNNLTAHRKLIDFLLRTQQLESVDRQLPHAIMLARKLNDTNALTRLLFSSAYYHHITGQPQAMLNNINEATHLAKESNDWLYQAYLSELLAKHHVDQKEFNRAKGLYHQALKFHRTLKCPVGESNIWLNLARLASLTGDTEQYDKALNIAQEISNRRDLVAIQTHIQQLRRNNNTIKNNDLRNFKEI